jgi:glycosyltransferase involved in cell wall biosynthesis
MVRPWICCQIGAREHYAMPRYFDAKGQLACLITDAWVSPRDIELLPKTALSQKLSERFHPDLSQAPIRAFTPSAIAFELGQSLQKCHGWSRVINRNQWFQSQAVRTLKQLNRSKPFSDNTPILFAYSYAALDLFSYAKSQGWTTILGQIDPGIFEEEIVFQEHQRYPELASQWQPAPAHYWQQWYQECELADHILVNSDWAEQALHRKGIGLDKTVVMPLSYTPPKAASHFIRQYPKQFNSERPLRVLFLGQVILRKGIARLLDAIPALTGKPIEFWIVGTLGINIPQDLQQHPQIRWVGSVPRSAVDHYYRSADVFILPTLSDGFALTQLEAQAWQLPLIVSRYCGEVGAAQHSLLHLDSVSGEAISQILVWCLNNASILGELAQRNTISSQLSLPKILDF